MPSLGDLYVNLRINAKGMNTGLAEAKKLIRQTAKELNMTTKEMGKAMTFPGADQATRNLKRARIEAENLGKAIRKAASQDKQLEKLYGGAIKVKTGFKEAADGSFIMSRSISTASKQSIMDMFKLQNFLGKIIHYITFSIGVQMVMLIRSGLQSVIDTFTEFERSIVNTTTVSGYLRGSFDLATQSISDLAMSLSKDSVYSSTEAAKALYSLASAGYDVVKMSKDDLIPILNYAAATQIDLDMAFQAVTKTMKQFGLTLDDTTEIVDTFTSAITTSYATAEKLYESFKYVGSIAGELNQNLQTVTAALSVLYDRGLEGGQAGQRLNMIFTKLLKPTDRAQEELANMGVSLRDINPYTHDLVDILYKLQAANFDAADAATMFRARTAAAAMILVSEVDKIAQFRNELQLTAGLTKSLAEKQIETLWGSFKTLRNEVEIVSIEFGTQLAPILSYLSNIITTKLLPSTSSFNTVLEGLLNTLRLFKPILTALISSLVFMAPLLIGLYASAKLAAMALGETAVAAYVSKTQLVSLKGALLGIVSTTLPLVVMFSLLSDVFGPLGGLFTALSAAIMLVVIAHKMQILTLGSVIKQKLLDTLSTAKMISWEQYHKYSLMSLIKIYILKNTLFKAGRIIIYGLSAAYGLLIGLTSLLTGGTYAEAAAHGAAQIAKILHAGATTVLTASQIALNVAMYACPIFLLIAGIYLLINYWDDLTGAVNNVVRSITDWLGITKKETTLDKERVENLSKYLQKVNDVIDLERDRIEIQSEIIRLESQESENLKEGTEAYDNYTTQLKELEEVERDITEKRQEALKTGQDILDWLRGTSENMDMVIGSYQDYIQSTTRVEGLESSLANLRDKQTDALNEYIEAVNTSGTTSEDAANKWDTYIQISEQISGSEKELTETESNRNDAVKKLGEEEAKLGGIEKERYKVGKDIIDMQTQMIEYESQLAKLRARQALLQQTLYNWNKILEEQTKDLWEKKLKLLEAEEALYKLNKESPSILDEIFKALANEGMLNDEIIADYRELQEAQAELLKARIEYFDVISDLSPEERESVELATEEYKKLLEEGLTHEEAFNIAFGNIGFNIDLDSIERYLEAENRLAGATQDFGSYLEPILDSLRDMNVLTSQQVEAFYDWLSIIPQINQQEQNLLDQQAALKAEYIDMTQTMANLWNAVAIQTSSGGTNIQATWQAMLGTLSFLDSNTRNYLMTTQGLSALLGRTVTSFDSVEAGTLTAAAAVLYAANNEKLLGTELLSVNTLLDMMNGAPPFEALEGASENALEPMGDMPATLSEINIAINNLDTVMGTMDTTMENLSNTLINLVNQIKNLNKQVDQGSFFDIMKRGWEKTIGSKGWWTFWDPNDAKGAIHGLQKGIKKTKGATPAVIGEDGAEAVVPLEGANRKYGLNILNTILPKYFPDLLLGMQSGGILDKLQTGYWRSRLSTAPKEIERSLGGIGPGDLSNIKNIFERNKTRMGEGGNTIIENWNIYGTINVTSQDANDFMRQLKYKTRTSKRY